jgi:excisionase family DNA binding protein
MNAERNLPSSLRAGSRAGDERLTQPEQRDLMKTQGARSLPADVKPLSWAAERLGIGVSTAYRLAPLGEIPGAFKVGSQWRISVPRFERLVRAAGPNRGRNDCPRRRQVSAVSGLLDGEVRGPQGLAPVRPSWKGGPATHPMKLMSN